MGNPNPPFVVPGEPGDGPDDLSALTLVCPSCRARQLAPIDAAEARTYEPTVAEDVRWFECGGCRAVVPVTLALGLDGVRVTTGRPMVDGGERTEVAALIPVAFAATHHPWRVLMTAEASRDRTPFGRLPELRRAMQKAGEMGGGIACPGCGKRPLEPIADPAAATCFAPSVRIYFACPGCRAIHRFRYDWDAEGGRLVESREDGAPERDLVLAMAELSAALAGDRTEKLGPALEKARAAGGSRQPGLADRIAEAERKLAGRLDPERCAGCAGARVKPLLRRLGLASPLLCEDCQTVSCQVAPRVRLHGNLTRRLVEDMESRARSAGAVGILHHLSDRNLELPFLVKVPAIASHLAAALIELRKEAAGHETRFLPVADRAGLHLVAGASGERRWRLPHMQAKDKEPPIPLGFVDDKVYYQEPGELSLVAHPLVAGSAWRFPLDTPVIRILELGRALLVETVASLSLVSGRTGRARWSLARAELGGLDEWVLTGGTLVTCGNDELRTFDPATGTSTGTHKLPKRSRLLRLGYGDLAAPVAAIDQGYGPGVVAPRVEAFKGGIKPLAVPEETLGTPDLLHLSIRGGKTIALWGSEAGYGDLCLISGPLEKKFAAWAKHLESAPARAPDPLLVEGGRCLFVPGKRLFAVDRETGEELEIPEAPCRLAVRGFGIAVLALDPDRITAFDAKDPTRLLWSLEMDSLAAVDLPGATLTAPRDLPGGTSIDPTSESSAVGLPGMQAEVPEGDGDDR